VDCGTYIENYLSAHADGELAGEELRAAKEHVAGCDECREALAAERALKSLLHDHLATLKAPSQVRDRIMLALEREQAAEVRAAPQPTVRSASRVRWLRPRVWVPAAIAALLLIAVTRLKSVSPPGHEEATPLEEVTATEAVPIFDLAAHHLDSFQRKFEPNVPSGSAGDVASAYMDHKMPGYLWNFGPAGYQMQGGRLETLPNGQIAALTYYQGEKGGILCTYMHYDGPFPGGAVNPGGEHTFYVYKGYSICLSKYPRGDFICLLISRRPMAEFMQTVSESML